MEPPPQEPKATFEEQGLERTAVLENMAPLGTPPSARLKAKLKNDLGRRAAPTRSDALVGMEDFQDTPETMSSAEPPTRPTSQGPEDSGYHQITNGDDVDDDEYVPNAKSAKHSRPSTRNGIVVATPQKENSHVLGIPGTPTFHRHLGMAVKSAVDKANRAGKLAVGLAISQMFEESANEPHLAAVMDSIFSQDPAPKYVSEFNDYIKKAKRHFKVTLRLDDEPKAKKPRLTLTSSRFGGTTANQPISPSLEVPSIVAASSRSANLQVDEAGLRRSSRSKTPRNAPMTNGDLGSITVAAPAVQEILSFKPTSNPDSNEKPIGSRRTAENGRNNSSSDSELSEVDEEIIQAPPPEMGDTNGGKPLTEPSFTINFNSNYFLKKGKGKANTKANSKVKPPRLPSPGPEELALADRLRIESRRRHLDEFKIRESGIRKTLGLQSPAESEVGSEEYRNRRTGLLNGQSRPRTPVLAPPGKRVKQGARTKVS